MASPNQEQLVAIEHNGGVLLQAGAGSGKTFVLKEHLIYLTKNWIQEFKNSSELSFDSFIKSKFRKIVLMTFTIKAAGELEIRLQREFLAMIEEDTDQSEYWQIASDSLDFLNVSTIHGFCFKLIKGGYFENVAPEQDILTDTEFNEIILTLLNNWLSKESNKALEIYDIVLKEKNNVFQALVSIFSDASLRDYWLGIKSSKDIDLDSNQVMLELFKSKNLIDIFLEEIDLDPEFSKKAWYPFVEKFIEEKKDISFNLDGIRRMYTFFEKEQFKIPRKPTGKTIPLELIAYFDQIKDLKDYLKKYGEHFVKFIEYENTRVAKWFEMIKSLVDYIESEYSKSPGMTFADLEYIVYQGVKDPEAVKRIAEEFQYFIVDEFQDTSFIQFAIVEKIIQNNFDKLFCVGDLKQAIYGFRGGELKVFQDCQKKVSKYLLLSNNYRSLENVIEFNNKIFDDLFKRGIGFKGNDPHRIEVTPQLCPIDQADKGDVKLLQTELSFLEEYKLKNSDVDYLEMLVMYHEILEVVEHGNIAVLYKKLKPSLQLINQLISHNISFTAQVKIPFMEDPIIGLFNILLEYSYNLNENKNDFLNFMTNSYLSLMGSRKEVEVDIDDFKQRAKNIGLYHAFCDFLDKFGIKNSNYKNNLQQIHTIINAAQGDIEKILILLGRQSSTAYSLDFQYGGNPGQITIMTAHASKGLEFDHVFLGGIYTNENSPMMTSSIGKIPLSFKWTDTIHGKKKYKTPYLIWEEELLKQKEFSESKRLFYVANTRAKKALYLVSLDFGLTKRSKNQSNSWAAGLFAWIETNAENLFTVKNRDIKDDVDMSYFESEFLQLPLYHIDNIGLLNIKSESQNVYLSELSVTRLATLTECPKKFYFQNIVKINSNELSLLDTSESKIIEIESEDALSSKSFSNTAMRGTRLHEQLSQVICSNDWENSVLDPSITWVVDKLKNYLDNYFLISEYPIKFELFGYMISGIPDLVIRPKDQDNQIEIWDFKTGAFSEDKLNPYWFQLYSYAYAEYLRAEVDQTREIKLVLCFIDEEKLVEKTIHLQDVEKYLSKAMENLDCFELENLNYCKWCPYEIICQK